MAKQVDSALKSGAGMIARWTRDPVEMVRDLWKVEPDAWQAEALRAYRTAPRLAMAACAGPGKSAVLSWIGWNFVLTRAHAMVGATSITADNLKSNLWTEFARWYERSDLLKAWFDMTKTYIASKEFPATWRIEARTWAKDADDASIGNALRGLHAEYVMWLLDETGDYPNSIMPVVENIFAGNPKEAHIVQAGNPSRIDGPLYRACTVARELWKIIKITADPDDPNRTPRVSIEHAREQIEQYGRENPWVMINILGQFPPGNLNALITIDEVRAAMNRMYREYELTNMPRVLGVDVAREGADQSIIVRRRGLQMFPMMKYRGVDSVQGAALVAREWREFTADACFIDSTGGFGSGWIDQLRQLGRQPVGVHFSGSALQAERYINKRAEMAMEFCDWIRRGGAMPADDRLLQALTQTTYMHRGDRMLMEPKDDVKKKLGWSPDEMDAAMLTFAAPVQPRDERRRSRTGNAAAGEYEPFRDMESPLPG